MIKLYTRKMRLRRVCLIAGADTYDVPFAQMCFGGTEKEILSRGTGRCTDMARVGVVLLMCNGLPTRVVYLVSPAKAYHGHADGKWMMGEDKPQL